MTDDPNTDILTPEEQEAKAAADAVISDPEYIPEPDDPRDAETVDGSIEEPS